MAGENGHLECPASSQELEEALDRLYKGTTNVALQAADLGISLERSGINPRHVIWKVNVTFAA